MMRRYYPILVLLLLSVAPLSAQTVRIDARRAERSYRKSNYRRAISDYVSSISRDSTYLPAHLGLGDALYRIQDTVSAVRSWMRIAQTPTSDPTVQAQAFHNIGNTLMAKKEYDKAIEAYKESLRRNPTDEETRYNLALAIKLNKKPPRQGGGGGGGSSQSDSSGTPPEQQEQSNDQQNNPSNIDKDQSDRILDALRQNERQTRRRLNQRQPQQTPQNKKNW